jgi:hypothetical protein
MLDAQWTQAIVRPEGFGTLKKNALTPSALEPATFRLVAKSLIHNARRKMFTDAQKKCVGKAEGTPVHV